MKRIRNVTQREKTSEEVMFNKGKMENNMNVSEFADIVRGNRTTQQRKRHEFKEMSKWLCHFTQCRTSCNL